MSEKIKQVLPLLQDPATWCRGAEQLVEIGDSAGILPLLEAYKVSMESSKLCLMEAMDSLGAVEFAGRLWLQTGQERKMEGLYLMKLFPDEKNLPHLLNAVNYPDEQIVGQALNVLIAQIRTTEWISTMLEVLKTHKNEKVRLEVINELARHKSPKLVEALKKHMANETSSENKKRILELIESRNN